MSKNYSTSYLILFKAVRVTTSAPCSNRSGIRLANRNMFTPYNNQVYVKLKKQNKTKQNTKEKTTFMFTQKGPTGPVTWKIIDREE